MSLTQAIFAFTCVAALAVGLALYRAAADRGICERLGLAALPFLCCTVAWHWVVSVAFQSSSGFWNGARLAPAMGLLHGYTLYYPANEGPLTGWIYGPVAALAYLPAVLVGSSGVQILTARVLSLVYYYAAPAWVLLGGGGSRRGRPGLGGALMFLTFVLLTSNSRALRYSATEVHADAPALGLAALAIVVMVRWEGGKNPRACALSLILALLAVWAKQLTVPLLLVVLPAYALATGASRSPFRFLMPGFVGGLGLTLVLLAAFDPQNLMFNVVTIPSRHPLRAHGMVDFLYPLIVLQQKHTALLIVLAVGLLGRVAAAAEGPGVSDVKEKIPLLEGDWLIFFTAGLAAFPFSIAAYSMVAADDNSMSFCIYFLALGALLLLKPLLGTAGTRPRRPTPLAWLLLVGLALMLAIVEDEALGIALVERKGAWQDSLLAERVIRDHAGEVYFPWNPQCHLQVEGRYYHFEDGIYDRSVSGFMPTPEHFFRHIPPNTRLVCYPPNAAGLAPIGAMRYLKGFRPTRVAGLPPSWSCFERPAVDPAPEVSGPAS